LFIDWFFRPRFVTYFPYNLLSGSPKVQVYKVQTLCG
jgi:hypothetical protein